MLRSRSRFRRRRCWTTTSWSWRCHCPTRRAQAPSVPTLHRLHPSARVVTARWCCRSSICRCEPDQASNIRLARRALFNPKSMLNYDHISRHETAPAKRSCCPPARHHHAVTREPPTRGLPQPSTRVGTWHTKMVKGKKARGNHSRKEGAMTGFALVCQGRWLIALPLAQRAVWLLAMAGARCCVARSSGVRVRAE